MSFQSTAEDAGECDNVVDLVREIAASGADNACPCFFCEIRHDLRNGVSHCKQNSIGIHGSYHLFRHNARSGNTDENISTL